MLVLSRKNRQSIVIQLPTGQLVRVTVTGVDRGHVFLSFDAPKEVPIMRAELLTAAKRARDD